MAKKKKKKNANNSRVISKIISNNYPTSVSKTPYITVSNNTIPDTLYSVRADIPSLHTWVYGQLFGVEAIPLSCSGVSEYVHRSAFSSIAELNRFNEWHEEFTTMFHDPTCPFPLPVDGPWPHVVPTNNVTNAMVWGWKHTGCDWRACEGYMFFKNHDDSVMFTLWEQSQ